MSKDVLGNPRWDAVVCADDAFFSAMGALPRDELGLVLVKGLERFDYRRTALHVLLHCDPTMVGEVRDAFYPLLLVSHSLLQESRRVLLTLPEAQMVEHLTQITDDVINNPASDYEAYRRLGELLSMTNSHELLARLVAVALGSSDEDIREFGEDFSEV
jgi:hypothetical protein